MRFRHLVGLVSLVAAGVTAPAALASAQPGTQTSQTTLSADNNPAVTGQEVTFTATVTDPAQLGTPTGTVEFQSNGTDLPGCSSVTVQADGTAQCPVSSGFTADSYSISALYSGDETYAPSSDSLTETVNQDATSTGLGTSNAGPVAGQSVTYTATVSAASPGSGTPTGSVEFQSNGVDLPSCSAVALTGDAAQCVVSSGLPAGTSAITAIYSGDTNYTTSTGSLNQKVNKDAVVEQAVASANPVKPGASVTFTATVAAKAPGSGTPTGTVTFSVTNNQFAQINCTGGNTVALSGGTATCTVNSLPLKNSPYSVVAAYNGDSNFITNGAFLTETVLTPTTTAIKAAPKHPHANEAFSLTANVSPTSGNGTPTGTATFTITEGSNSYSCDAGNTAALQGGSASCSLSGGLAKGTYTVKVVYSGDSSFETSSAKLVLKVKT